MAQRQPTYPILNLILNRWSPRAMSGEPITHTELMTLFEAARWAPSSYNSQLWRFLYATRDMEEWKTMFDLLVPINQTWCKNASAFIVVLSRKKFDLNEAPSRTHSFDAGSAWENLALQGFSMNLVIHCLEGFDYDKAREVLGVPEQYDIEVMIAVGKPGNKDDLSEQLRVREQQNDRKRLDEIVFKGGFPKGLK